MQKKAVAFDLSGNSSDCESDGSMPPLLGRTDNGIAEVAKPASGGGDLSSCSAGSDVGSSGPNQGHADADEGSQSADESERRSGGSIPDDSGDGPAEDDGSSYGVENFGALAADHGTALASVMQRILGDAIHVQAIGGNRRECRAFCRRGLANYEQFSAEEHALASRLLAAAIEGSFKQAETASSADRPG